MDDLGARTPLDLLRLQAGAVEELRRCGIVRTGNNPASSTSPNACAPLEPASERPALYIAYNTASVLYVSYNATHGGPP